MGETLKKKAIIITSAILTAAVVAGVVHSNVVPELNRTTVVCSRLPKQFDGFVVAQVSDFHNCRLGKDHKRVISLLEKSEPDIIVITGDLIDSRRTDVDTALDFVNRAVKIAPCYFVTGNHEARVKSEYSKLKKGLEAAGVTVLDGKCTEIEKDGAKITVAGFDDPSFAVKEIQEKYDDIADKELEKLGVSEKDFVLLLAHRPEIFEVYAKHNADLVLCGHAHGGQFRLPFVGGVFVPNQGLFPEYDSGYFASGNSQMIISRGIGNSLMPVRLNNRPEVVAVELKAR